MKATLYDWAELLLKHKGLVIILFASAGSVATNASQYMTNSDHEVEKVASEKQIIAITSYYEELHNKPTKQPTKIIKKIYQCGTCAKLMTDHKRKFH